MSVVEDQEDRLGRIARGKVGEVQSEKENPAWRDGAMRSRLFRLCVDFDCDCDYTD